MPESKIITVFGSSQPTPDTDVYNDAYQVGRALGQAGWTVASGGYRGIMEAVSKGAYDVGGNTIGITTAHFDKRGFLANPYIHTEQKQPDYHERLLRLVDIADGFVIMRGGSGTLNEFFHIWEMMKNESIPARPIVLYGNLWKRIMDCLTGELGDEAAFAKHMNLLSFASNPDTLIERLTAGFNKIT